MCLGILLFVVYVLLNIYLSNIDLYWSYNNVNFIPRLDYILVYYPLDIKTLSFLYIVLKININNNIYILFKPINNLSITL